MKGRKSRPSSLRRCSPFTVAPFTRRCSSHSPSPSTADAKGRVATAAAGVQPSDAGCADALHRHDVCRPAPHSPSAHAPEQPDAARDERQAALGGSGEPARPAALTYPLPTNRQGLHYAALRQNQVRRGALLLFRTAAPCSASCDASHLRPIGAYLNTGSGAAASTVRKRHPKPETLRSHRRLKGRGAGPRL